MAQKVYLVIICCGIRTEIDSIIYPLEIDIANIPQVNGENQNFVNS